MCKIFIATLYTGELNILYNEQQVSFIIILKCCKCCYTFNISILILSRL